MEPEGSGAFLEKTWGIGKLGGVKDSMFSRPNLCFHDRTCSPTRSSLSMRVVPRSRIAILGRRAKKR
jgi:hypothetical protein